MSLPDFFRPHSFEALDGWRDDDQREAYAAFRRSAFHALVKPYRSGSLGVAFGAFAGAHAEARAIADPNREQARRFFERHFRPFRIVPPETGRGFVTGFYEPVVEASPVRTDRFRHPVLKRPDDLVDVNDSNRPEDMDPYLAFARSTPDGLVPYFERSEIDGGALNGRELEIAWLESKVDLFFIHVQGAARLDMTDGRTMRITYAAKAGHRFTGIGGELVRMGELPAETISMQTIRAWLAANPGRVDDILWKNRSYIFFRIAPVEDTELGPVAAAKVPLTPGRSMAVDRLLHTFGTPFFVDAATVRGFGDPVMKRLMIAQDTGSAITGPARGDLFAGSGDAAGEIAGVIKEPADFTILVPLGLASA